MPEPGLGARERRLCLLALVATFSIVAMSSSLTWPILAESLRRQGYDETAIGVNAAAQFAGIMFVAGSATWLIPRLGFFRAVLLGLALVAAMLAALPAVRGDSLWLGLRFVVGIGNSLLFTAGDTWINQIVENRVRGRWIGIYNTAGMAGWAAGPILGRRRAGGGWGEIPATGWRNLAALGAPGLRPMKQGPPKRPRALRSKPHGVLSAIERPSCPGSSRQQPPHLLDSPW